jgi:hypothetical protein
MSKFATLVSFSRGAPASVVPSLCRRVWAPMAGRPSVQAQVDLELGLGQ